MKRILLCFSAIMLAGTIRAQWPNNFLLTSGNTFFGTQFNAPIDIYTNGLQRAQFTTNNGLGANSLIPGIGLGDGLKIIHKTNGCGIVSTPQASVDIWTSCSNGTNIRWDGSGQISGTNNRFEMWANYFGLFFNTSSPNGRYKFARLGAVTGYVGTNNFWRIGMQADSDNLNGQRRLHVVDNEVQFRLSYAQPGTNSVFFTDFLSNSVGNLQIQPSGGRVGVNANANPTATLDVFGNARIRNVQAETPNSILIGVNANGPSDVNVRRLDFTGNNNQVLLGNGTWGTLPPTNPPVTLPGANNGVSRFTLFGGNAPYRLGDEYTNIFPIFNTNTPLTVDRQVRLNGKNFVFSGEGRVGIGLNSYFDNNVPLTMLHLEGQNNTSFDGGQFRAWMRTGMFARENSDAMYVGLKSEGFNRADMIVDLSNSKVLVKIK